MYSNILVTGIGGPAGRSAATYLQRNGFSVIGTDMREVDTLARKFYKIPAADDLSFSSVLLDIIMKENISLLIPTVSEELLIIAKLRKFIEECGCAVHISPIHAVDIANDKLKTAFFMTEHNIPVPKFFHAKAPKERILEELGLPLLSKPYIGRGGRGVALYKTKEEFFKETRENIIYQEFIPGEEFDLNLFLDRKNTIASGIVLKKTILKEGITGNAVAVERTDREDIISLGIKAALSLEMEGPLDMDIRLREDGTPVLLEINARIGGNVLSATEILDSLIRSWRIMVCV
jgi:carbamoyl-phosphate synthase large subunit